LDHGAYEEIVIIQWQNCDLAISEEALIISIHLPSRRKQKSLQDESIDFLWKRIAAEDLLKTITRKLMN